MPRIAPRTREEIGLLSEEIRQHRPFTGTVRGWFRANLDLIDALQAGTWQPTRQPGEPSRFVHPRRWPLDSIREALVLGGVHYANGSLTLHTVNSELRDLRREAALAQAVQGGQPEQLARYVSGAASVGRDSVRPVKAPEPMRVLSAEEPGEQEGLANPTPNSVQQGPRPAERVPEWKRKAEENRSKAPLSSPMLSRANQIQQLIDGDDSEKEA